MSEGDKLEKAKKVILAHLDKLCAVKSTKWVENEAGDEYIEINAGFSEAEMKIIQECHYRDMKKYFKLKDLLDDLL